MLSVYILGALITESRMPATISPSILGAVHTFSVARTKGNAAIRPIKAESLQETVTKILPFSGDNNIHSLPAYLINIFTTDRKVGRIDRQILLPTPVNGFL